MRLSGNLEPRIEKTRCSFLNLTEAKALATISHIAPLNRLKTEKEIDQKRGLTDAVTSNIAYSVITPLSHLGLLGYLERILPRDPGMRMMSSTLVK